MSGFAGYAPPRTGPLGAGDDAEGWADPLSFAAVLGSGEGERAAAGLSLRMSAPGEFRIAICCGRGRPLMELGPFADDEVVATWRGLSERSGLPFVVAAETETDEPEAAVAAPPRPVTERRKKFAVLAARRPRFLCRRKTARLPRSPLVHRGPEIAGGAGR